MSNIEQFRISNFLTDEQKAKLKTWRDEQNAIVVKQQEERDAKIEADKSLSPEEKEDRKSPFKPYYGVIGGELTYSFTPTGFGTALVVRNEVTEAELDLSEYDKW